MILIFCRGRLDNTNRSGVRALVPRAIDCLIPAARTLDSSFDCQAAGISLISRAAATPTLRAYQSALRAAGIKWAEAAGLQGTRYPSASEVV